MGASTKRLKHLLVMAPQKPISVASGVKSQIIDYDLPII
jgi:hypothetical protein